MASNLLRRPNSGALEDHHVLCVSTARTRHVSCFRHHCVYVFIRICAALRRSPPNLHSGPHQTIPCHSAFCDQHSQPDHSLYFEHARLCQCTNCHTARHVLDSSEPSRRSFMRKFKTREIKNRQEIFFRAVFYSKNMSFFHS